MSPNDKQQEALAALIAFAARPGWRTTEWWLSLVIAVNGLFVAYGVFPLGGDAGRIAGLVVSCLAVVGYAVCRGLTKGGPSAPAAPSSATVGGELQGAIAADPRELAARIVAALRPPPQSPPPAAPPPADDAPAGDSSPPTGLDPDKTPRRWRPGGGP